MVNTFSRYGKNKTHIDEKLLELNKLYSIHRSKIASSIDELLCQNEKDNLFHVGGCRKRYKENNVSLSEIPKVYNLFGNVKICDFLNNTQPTGEELLAIVDLPSLVDEKTSNKKGACRDFAFKSVMKRKLRAI